MFLPYYLLIIIEHLGFMTVKNNKLSTIVIRYFNLEIFKFFFQLHRRRRKLQKTYHISALNSQYTYYGAGLLSNYDPFPEHQDRIKEKYGLKPKQS